MYLYGASGHAKVIIEILETNGQKISGLFDDNPLITEIIGYRCYGTFSYDILEKNELIISIGDNLIRKTLVDKINIQSYGLAIHPQSSISKRAEISHGTVIMKGVNVNACCKIGNHVILNTACSIDHDCQIDDFVHISPNATLCGNVSIAEGSHIGAGAIVIPGIKIGKWTTIGAGSVIIKDVPDFATTVGNPGRIIKINQTKA